MKILKFLAILLKQPQGIFLENVHINVRKYSLSKSKTYVKFSTVEKIIIIIIIIIINVKL